MIDLEGNLIVKPKYKRLKPFYNGLAWATNTENKRGFVGMNGDWAIEPIFKEANSFKQRFTIVRLNNRDGIINTKGEWIVEPNFIG